MDEIIDREQRGEATPAEIRRLIEWRRASLANEHEYRSVVRLLSATRALGSTSRSEPPSAAALLSRARERSPQETPHRRWTPWLIGAAAAAGLAAGFFAPHRDPRPNTLGVA